ncbi:MULTISPECIES: hypothetical protein [Bacilli]|uniref:hypothetical protein n=2 Tax=Bacillota TaxID=1239 RepID=UPI00031D7A00|nr:MULTISPECIES: hypothetical protein [Bacilli]MBL0383065.1 hypothetical protein [Staphylococcus sp. S59]MBL0401926.1 hypothetical protein [Staphylococcus sp. S36]OLF30412.1 hypothetical protein BSZ11_13005 [Staphylococcus sp. 47.1]RXZ29445.1 hypothetical protein ESM34_02980 [Staphylococcus sp. SNAZ 59]RXZ32950.1 hypothetical protein ESM33_11035 [Staphylococcus sp. SNAZ 36]
MKFNDINIEIENVNLTSKEIQDDTNEDINEILLKLENLNQAKRQKYINAITLIIVEQLAEKEGRDLNRLFNMMVFDYIKNHHKEDYKEYVSIINEMSKKKENE